MVEVDYWADLPEKCKTSKKDRFNYIMGKLNGDSSSEPSQSTSEPSES